MLKFGPDPMSSLLTVYSYDSFKIFMGLPTTGGPMPEKKK
jgi:hypothetical protein